MTRKSDLESRRFDVLNWDEKDCRVDMEMMAQDRNEWRNSTLEGNSHVPVLHVGDGSSVVGLVSSACHVVRASGQLQLLGLDAGDRAVVQQWAEYAVALEQGNKDFFRTALQELNDYLADRVFIVGNYLTLADILLYHRLHPMLAALGVQEREQHVNVCRWFDNVQRWPRVRQHLPMLVILRNKIYS